MPPMCPLAHPLDGMTFVAFDTETTGFNADAGRLVEIAGVKFSLDGTILGTFQSLINPGIPIPPEVVRIHGITNMAVRGCPSAAVVLSHFFAFVEGPATVLVAHNAPFDLRFLQAEVARHALLPPAVPVLDTLPLARRYLPGLPNHRLDTVARSLGLLVEMHHRAFADSLLVQGIVSRLLAALPPQRALEEVRRARLRLAAPDAEPWGR
ncbi:MAG: 3'-5' exonuclease [Chloroflexi bacterium]|nr:3'-5' exonuclease [Chloroflexota bacterium]